MAVYTASREKAWSKKLIPVGGSPNAPIKYAIVYRRRVNNGCSLLRVMRC